MARTQLVYTDQPGPLPALYRVPANLELVLQSIVARFDGAAAASSFLPCLAVYSQDGRLMGRFHPGTELQIGDTGFVTYAPFLRAAAGAQGTSLPTLTPGLVYEYTLPADAASLDTSTDGPMAALFPANFYLLEIWLYARTTEATTQSQINMRVNGDVGANYDRQFLSGYDNATISAASQTGQTFWNLSAVHGALSTANYFSILRTTFPGYSSRTGFLSAEGQHAKPGPDGGAADGVPLTALQALGWRSAAAVTSFRIFPNVGGVNLKAGTRLFIFGR